MRVPPSACSTSQSMYSVRSPIEPRSTTARRLRPMSRWISCVRPPCLPRTASRGVRSAVAAGSMLYSAVSQPAPLPRRQPGTPSTDLAVHSTWVSPRRTMTEPSANFATSRSMDSGRSSSDRLPSLTFVTLSSVRVWPAHRVAAGREGRAAGRACGSG